MSSKGSFVPSEYQKAIFEWVEHGSGNAMVSAVAGSGKTTTLIEISRRVTAPDAVFFAFNKHIVEHLVPLLQGTTMTATTIHAFGVGVVRAELNRRAHVEYGKYDKLCEAAVEREWPQMKFREGGRRELFSLQRALYKLVDLSRLNLVDKSPDKILDLMDEHQIEVDNGEARRLATMVEEVCRAGVGQAETRGAIDFTDMVWLPCALNLPVPTSSLVLVDEAQDLNAAQRTLVIRAVRPKKGRLIAVGDVHQAIMAFAGADASSYERIRIETNAVELPLSICYRCPRSHVELARSLVPEIEARPGAPEGEIDTVLQSELLTRIKANDLLVCRKTAPLVPLCIDFIRHKIPARVRGRDVAAMLTKLARQVGEGIRFEAFPEALDAYRAERTAKLLKKKNAAAQILVLEDTCEALEACFDEFKARSVEELVTAIEAIFADEGASIWLSTVHRAKGLEADRVFILHPEFLPLVWKGQSPEQFQQELNLKYVALTRAKQSLFFVEERKAERKASAQDSEELDPAELVPLLAG